MFIDAIFDAKEAACKEYNKACDRLQHQRYFSTHAEQIRQRNRVYAATHKEQHKKRGEEYRKTHKQQIAEYYEMHHKELLEKAAVRRMTLRLEVLAHYGVRGSPICVVCGEARIACLSIDHINGGGYLQRQTLKRAGGEFYRWLRDNNYPEGYQTLCMNCNWVKRVEKHECKGRRSGR